MRFSTHPGVLCPCAANTSPKPNTNSLLATLDPLSRPLTGMTASTAADVIASNFSDPIEGISSLIGSLDAVGICTIAVRAAAKAEYCHVEQSGKHQHRLDQ